MIRETFTYPNPFDETQTVTEEVLFNLTTGEIAEMEMIHGAEGGLSGMIKIMSETQDTAKAVQIWRDLFARALCRRAPDGVHIVKRLEFFDEFSASEAYSQLLIRVLTDAQYAADFFNRLRPADADEVGKKLSDAANKASAESRGRQPQDHLPPQTPGVIVTSTSSGIDVQPNVVNISQPARKPTREELAKMTDEEYENWRNSQ